ncbi:protein mono-ADP-ribosyltransferase PARP12-like [Tachysurus ichikawai]
MSRLISSATFEAVCQNGGSLDSATLDQILRKRFTVADEVLREALCDFDRLLVVEGCERRSDCDVFSADTVIISKTTLRVCQNLPGQCSGCDTLHLCRYMVCKNCRFRKRCKNSHALDSYHNSILLSKAGLQRLGQSALFQLLLQNDPDLLPEVCSHYNKGNGEHGACRYQASCTNLHVCLHYLQDDCKFGATCKRAHSFDATAVKVLTSRGLSPENINNFSKIYKNRFLICSLKEKPPGSHCMAKTASPGTDALESPKPANEPDPNEICLFFIRRSCSFKEKCVRVHYNLPYRWQVLDKNGQIWKDLPNGEAVERAFCNPSNDVSPGPEIVNFISMTCGGRQVRRLSTVSSVTKPPNFILTTEWLWYWKNNKEQWTEYGLGEDAQLSTPLTSQTLENIYQSDPQTEIPVSSGSHTYMLYFKDMYQQNILYQTKREIRRRPRFVSALEVESKLKGETSSSSSVAVPAHWDRGALPSFSYKLVSLSRTEAEFLMVEKLFKQTMPKYKVNSIERNQNSSLWKVFSVKEQMKERNGGREVDERLLFHGTQESLIEAICEQNFDWRICGVNGTLYGKGSYFARDASYSDQYSRSADTTKKMFVARVLVGHYTSGHHNFVRPPPKTVGKGLYDSCVDNCSNASIFVIFEKYQIYPEFIIEYSPEESKCLIS